jgi:AcrR family transcriptional regulator
MNSQLALEQASDEQESVAQRVLDAAEALIRRFGIRKTSMGEVALRAAVSRATLYNYFADKEALVTAVFDRANRRFHEQAEAQVRRQRSIESKIVVAVVWSLQQGEGQAILDLRETEPETAGLLFMQGSGIRRCLDFWPSHIEQAIEAGELRADIDVTFAADCIHRLIASLVTFPPAFLQADAANSNAQLRRYLQQNLLQGLVA